MLTRREMEKLKMGLLIWTGEHRAQSDWRLTAWTQANAEPCGYGLDLNLPESHVLKDDPQPEATGK